MNLCIDQGNSSTKVGVFDDNVLVEYFAIEELSEVEIEKLFERFSIDACIISSVTMKYDELLDILNKKNIFLVQLDHHTAVPIVNKYETPHTLGKDRLAAIVGAVYLEPETGSNLTSVPIQLLFLYQALNLYLLRVAMEMELPAPII
mgnify:CR=1 FL=1